MKLIDRETLFIELWENTMTTVASNYKISVSELRKIIALLDIPTPGSGYWNKMSKKEYIRPALSPITSEAEIFLEKQRQLFDIYIKTNDATPSQELLTKIKNHEKTVSRWNKKNNSFLLASERTYADFFYWKRRNKVPLLAGSIQESNFELVGTFLSSLFSKCETLGMSINNDLSINVNGQNVILFILETIIKDTEALSDQQKKQWEQYENRDNSSFQGYKYIARPDFNKYQYKFSGKFTIFVKETHYYENNKDIIYRENSNKKLENYTLQLILDIYEQARYLKEKKEAEIERQNRIELQKQNKIEKQKEKELLDKLIIDAESYEKASRIRKYVAAIKIQNNSNNAEWIEWALKKADWLDPSVDAQDDILDLVIENDYSFRF